LNLSVHQDTIAKIRAIYISNYIYKKKLERFINTKVLYHSMSGIKCISTTLATEKIFNELKKLKPDDTSFSLMLALVCKEYIESKSKKSLKLDDFDSGFPDIFADVETWRILIDTMPVEDFKKLQRKHTQLGNLISKRVVKCL